MQTNCFDEKSINERMLLLKNRFKQTEDLIEEKINQKSAENESELRQLSECVNGLRLELSALKAFIESMEASNDNQLDVHKNNLIRIKNLLKTTNNTKVVKRKTKTAKKLSKNKRMH